MSYATPYTQLRDESRPDAGHGAATRAPALRARALADGADAIDRGDLTVRAWQITRPRARAGLAAALEALLTDAVRPRAARGHPVLVCSEEVEVARDEILRLVERLREPRPVRPRGVALARLLLTDGTGPLYAPSPNDELWRRLHRAAAALD